MKHLAAAAAAAALCTSSIDARREGKKMQTGRDFTTHFLPPTAAHHIRGRSRGHNKKLLTRSHLQLSLRATRQTLQVFIEIGNQLSCVPMPPNHFEIGTSKRKKRNGRGWGLLHRDCNISNYESCKTKGWGQSLWCLISCRQAFEEEQQMNPQFLECGVRFGNLSGLLSPWKFYNYFWMGFLVYRFKELWPLLLISTWGYQRKETVTSGVTSVALHFHTQISEQIWQSSYILSKLTRFWRRLLQIKKKKKTVIYCIV